jgi:ubiquinone biosynthesis protein COQ9
MTAKKPGKADADRRPEILAAVLAHVPFDGWSQAALARAADDLSLDKGLVRLVFPGGPLEVIDYFSASADADMILALKQARMGEFKVRERIMLAVRCRIEAVAPHTQAVRRAVNFLALPTHAPDGLAMLYRTVDNMWRAVGDDSTDFNFYTKRLTLAGVFSSTLLYWLGDESPDYGATWAFLDRRIAEVMQIEKCKAELKKPLDNLPDIWGFLGKLRYPGSGLR